MGLDRFVQAQENVWKTVLEELRAGQKKTHWMWFVFPQLRGLGRSSTAEFYGIADIDEARAYLRHSLLGARLAQATLVMLETQCRDAVAILGSVDALKFHSSLSLFAIASDNDAPFDNALDRFFGGQVDKATLELLDLT